LAFRNSELGFKILCPDEAFFVPIAIGSIAALRARKRQSMGAKDEFLANGGKPKRVQKKEPPDCKVGGFTHENQVVSVHVIM
jgi:hypothetical protein